MNVSIVLSFFVTFILIEAMDPDLQLCQDLFIDAAVSADDGIDYIFKGDYYWRFDTSNGFTVPPGYAQPISQRWTGLPTPIDSAFTIDEQTIRLSTIFIKDNNWFLYKGNNRRRNGTTYNWPFFPSARIQGAFTYYNSSTKMKDQPIFFIYNIDFFVKYSIQSIDRPIHVATNKAHRLGRVLLFLYDPNPPNNKETIADYIDVRAVLTNKNHLIIFGDKEFCSADINELLPKCIRYNSTKEINDLYGCPRKPRPTTTMMTTSSMTTSTPVITSETSSEYMSSGFELNTNEGLSETSIKTLDTTETNRNDWPTISSMNSTDEPMDEMGSKDNNNKSNIWPFIIALIVIIGIISIISLFTIIFTVRKKRKDKTSTQSLEMNDMNEDSDNETAINPNKTKHRVERNGSESAFDLDKKEPAEQPTDASEGLTQKSSELKDNSESNESLNTAMKRSKSSLTNSSLESLLSDEKTSSMIEADQLLETIRSKEDVED